MIFSRIGVGGKNLAGCSGLPEKVRLWAKSNFFKKITI